MAPPADDMVIGRVVDREAGAPRDCERAWSGDSPLRTGAERIRRARLKRLIDVVGAGLGLLLLSPFLLFVAVLIALESPGDPLFRQLRSGYRGAPFSIYKLRTMTVREDGATIVQAARDDRRITPLGRLLRRSSIDELPQLINVLKGEMSLIGPRPHALAHDAYYGAAISAYAGRFNTRPGLTGLAQVCGLRGQTADMADMAARVDKDLDYIRDWSLGGDVLILLRTALVFAFHPAAY